MKKNKNKYLLLWAMLLLSLAQVKAQIQQVVASNGQQLTGSNGQVSYTVGEPAITTLTSSGNAVTQGYQQSNLSVTAINNVPAPVYQVSVYPNPAAYQLTVYIQGLNQQAVFKLYDITGKVLLETTTTAEKSQLDLSHYAAGQYLLQLIDNKGITFSNQQIIKTN